MANADSSTVKEVDIVVDKLIREAELNANGDISPDEWIEGLPNVLRMTIGMIIDSAGGYSGKTDAPAVVCRCLAAIAYRTDKALLEFNIQGSRLH